MVNGFIALGVLVLVATTVAFGLGLYVLQKGGRSAPARFLAGYLLLQPFVFDPILFVMSRDHAVMPTLTPLLAGFVLCSFLPALLLGFAFTYPATAALSWGRRIAVAAAFLPPVLVSGFVALNVGDSWNPGVSGHLAREGILAVMVAFLFTFVGALLSAIVFAVRARRATTVLEKRRLRFMTRAVGIPLAVATAPFSGLSVLVVVSKGTAFDTDTLMIAFFASFIVFGAAAVLVPAVGMGLGLLRYKVLDFDQNVRRTFRFTLRRGTVVGAFVAVFFLVSEGSQVLIADETQNNLVGVAGAALLVFFLAPLQNFANRVADRAAPATADPAKYREFRRWEVYRAAYEEMSVDDQVTSAEGRALDALARSLSLLDQDRTTIEDQVRRERGGRV